MKVYLSHRALINAAKKDVYDKAGDDAKMIEAESIRFLIDHGREWIHRKEGGGKFKGRGYFRSRSGNMERALKYDIKPDYTEVLFDDAKFEVPYYKFVIQGTKKHRIKPTKPHGKLIFYWERKRRWVRLDEVNHPGITGFDFFGMLEGDLIQHIRSKYGK